MYNAEEFLAAQRTIAALKGKLFERAILDTISDPRLGIAPSAKEDVLNRARAVWIVDDEGTLAPKGGVPLYGTDGVSPMTPVEWVRSLRERNGHLFKIDESAGHEESMKSEFQRLAPLEKLKVANGPDSRGMKRKQGDG